MKVQVLAISLTFTTLSFANCYDLPKAKTDQEIKNQLSKIYDDQEKSLASVKKDRHEIGEELNYCLPKKNSKGLFLAFTGTGSFQPRMFHLMQKGLRCLSKNPNAASHVVNLYTYINDVVVAKKLKDIRWSGVERGPMTTLYTQAKDMDFVAFPSEEFEAIADTDAYDKNGFEKFMNDLDLAKNDSPKGVMNAIRCVKNYFKQAKELKIKPKLIVVTHSSGGTSAVKFLEKLKDVPNPVTEKNYTTASLVFSIDPVKEAHLALYEVIEQYAGQYWEDYWSFAAIKHKEVNVWSRSQPETLYKPWNAKTWINVYQTMDTLGLKGKLKFGIKGSVVDGADQNVFIKTGLGAGGHGEIAYHDKTLKLFKDAFQKEVP